MIRRLQAQRDCLEYALRLTAGLQGIILELGLGNGRTFDHLRAHAPGREIFVFERRPAAHPDCTPENQFLFEGDFRETLSSASQQLGQQGILAHCDIGSGHPESDQALVQAISTSLNTLLKPQAIILSDQFFSLPEWTPLELPGAIPDGRYHIFQKSAAR